MCHGADRRLSQEGALGRKVAPPDDRWPQGRASRAVAAAAMVYFN